MGQGLKVLYMDIKDNQSPMDDVMPTCLKFRFWPTFARHLREGVQYYGLMRAIRELWAVVFRVLRHHLRAFWRTKNWDLNFDLEYKVDTTRSNVSLRTQLMAAFVGHEYGPSEPWLFEQIMHALPVELRDYTFIDLGSGKGRSLLMAADHPFRRILGVEFMPNLHRAAERNISQQPLVRRHLRQMESTCMDARDFSFPIEPTVRYLFNPFSEPVFATVLTNVRSSLADNPRPFFVAYRDPEYEHLLKNCTWLTKLSGTPDWAIYKDIGC